MFPELTFEFSYARASRICRKGMIIGLSDRFRTAASTRYTEAMFSSVITEWGSPAATILPFFIMMMRSE